MLRAIIVILGVLSACYLSEGYAQKTSERAETPSERFERKGGRSIRAKITVGQDREVSTATIAKGRDMRLYDQVGHFDCSRWSPTVLKNGQENEKRIASALETARNLIWEHWQNKKRGYIRVTFDSVDAISTNEKTTSLVFKDADGEEWQVL